MVPRTREEKGRERESLWGMFTAVLHTKWFDSIKHAWTETELPPKPSPLSSPKVIRAHVQAEHTCSISPIPPATASTAAIAVRSPFIFTSDVQFYADISGEALSPTDCNLRGEIRKGKKNRRAARHVLRSSEGTCMKGRYIVQGTTKRLFPGFVKLGEWLRFVDLLQAGERKFITPLNATHGK